MQSLSLAEWSPRQRRRAVIAILGLVVLGLIGLRIAQHSALRRDTQEQAVLNVAVVRPARSQDGETLVLPATVQATVEAPLYARTSGYLKRWLVDIGAQVKAGQLLAEIEAPEVRQQLAQAAADVQTAEANAHLADVTAERWKTLLASGAVSNQAADEKIGDAAAKKASANSARANYQRLREIEGFTRIVAPFDGVITARNTDIGNLISAGGGGGPELFRIADLRQLRIYVLIPQAFAQSIKPGATAQLSFAEYPGQLYPAQLTRISGAMNPASRTLQAQLVMDNIKGELIPGGYAEAHFALAATGMALRLPANCIQFNGAGASVAVIDGGGKIAIRPVILGRDFGPTVEILNGVSEQDRVVINPPDTLLAGQDAKIVTPAKDGK